MKKTIQDLAYLIKKAKDNNEPKPIVFLGAGVSVSGDIPLARGIIDKILTDFKDKPSVKNLSDDKKGNYYELMSALNAKERRAIFQYYIKNSKINIAHIYLAQLVNLGYIDYVLTVNFDDLLLRACGLFNYTMPIYDISNVSNFTTTTYQPKSIIYLHGQHYGEWLLNAKGELEKDKGRVSQLLNKICDNRTWIVAGYSGDDNVFNEINNFGNFENELYWIGYLDHKPSEKVQKELLDSNKGAHLISGYDADTFFLDLHAKLKIETPKIIDKPFSFLQSMLKKVNVPKPKTDNKEHKDLYKGLSERMKITTNWVNKAIDGIQEKDSVEKFKQEIIEAYLKGDFNKSTEFLKKIDKLPKAKKELADFMITFGNSFVKKELNDEKSYLQSIEKYKKALELNPNNEFANNNWGLSLSRLAEFTNNEKLYFESFEKFRDSIRYNSKYELAYFNYGNALYELAIITQDKNLFKESFIQYEKAIKFNIKYDSAYNNYGNSLRELAKINQDIDLFKESFSKFEKALKITKNDLIYNNYGNALYELAKITQDKNLFKESFTQFEKALEMNPKNDSYYNNYGISLAEVAIINQDIGLFKDSFTQFKKALEINSKEATTYHNYGIGLYNLAIIKQDESLFRQSFTKHKKAIEINPNDSIYNSYGSSLSELAKITQDEHLFKDSFAQFEKALEMNPKNDLIYNNYGTALIEFYLLKKDSKLLTKALSLTKKSYNLGGNSYNIACVYALLKDKNNALKYLKVTLDNNQTSKGYVIKDKEWQELLQDKDFKKLLSKYK